MYRTLITGIFIFIVGWAGCSKDPGEDPDNGNGNPPDTTLCYTLEREVAEDLSGDDLLDIVQQQTLKYFWDFAEPNSGMARERNTSGNLVTTGGTGFGIMAMIAGVDRGFLQRDTVVGRLLHMFNFLQKADRHHGAWPHWLNGITGETIAFSPQDDGGDLVETSFLVQGMIAAREYFSLENQREDSLRALVDTLWYGVEWDWYRNGENVLYWHWSPNHGFGMGHAIRGWNEALITYVLAASSPTHPINRQTYEQGWAGGGQMANGGFFYNLKLPLGPNFGGPLFFAHYSFLGLDPRGLQDQYADYFEQNRVHSLINHQYAVRNPMDFCLYNDSIWGLTASDDPLVGYSAHAPFGNWGIDNGTITPTAALSSMPYTPEESMKALRVFYYYMHNKLWGPYGFRDAFNLSEEWFASSYIAIDQGPIVVMIENHRSGLLWNVFMQNADVLTGLSKLGFTINDK